ncbi:AbrB family transcriptional regulator [Streptococcus dentasini]
MMIGHLFLTLTVGLLGGVLAKKIGLPAPFMVGSMIAVATVSIITGQMVIASSAKILAQIVSGAYIGQQVSKSDLRNLPHLAKPIAGLMGLFTLNMVLVGLIFIAFFQLDPVTVFLSCLPGGIVDVSLMSIDMGAQSDIVATLQSARLIGILIILPLWVAWLTKKITPISPTASKADISAPPQQLSTHIRTELTKSQQWKNNALILCIASLGGLLGWWLGIPVGALIFSLIFSCVLKILRDTKQLSISIRYLAQIVAGALIGINFTQTSLFRMFHLLIPILLLLASYLLINGLFGFLVYKTGLLDLQSALFASSPAGATDISLLAGELGGDMPKIAGMQISRTIYTTLIMPFIVRWLVAVL